MHGNNSLFIFFFLNRDQQILNFFFNLENSKNRFCAINNSLASKQFLSNVLVLRLITKPSFNSSILSYKKSGKSFFTSNSSQAVSFLHQKVSDSIEHNIKKVILIILLIWNLKLVFEILESFFKAVEIINFLIRIIILRFATLSDIIISFNISAKKVINIQLKKSILFGLENGPHDAFQGNIIQRLLLNVNFC